MPYKPTFPSPYMQAIDASKDGGNVFRCLINPRDSVYGYELTISSVENELKEAGETTETETETHTISRTVDGTTKSVDGSDVALEIGASELPVIGSSAEDSWLAVVVPKDLLTDGRSYTWRIKLFGSKVDAGQQNIVVAEGLSGTYYNEPQYNRFKLSGNPIIFSKKEISASSSRYYYDWKYDEYMASDYWLNGRVWNTGSLEDRLHNYGVYKNKNYEGLYYWDMLPNIKDMFIPFVSYDTNSNPPFCDLGYWRGDNDAKVCPINYFIPRRNNKTISANGYFWGTYDLGRPIVFINYSENVICTGKITLSSNNTNLYVLRSGNTYDEALETNDAGSLVSIYHTGETSNNRHTIAPYTTTGQFTTESCSLKNSLAYSGTSLPSNIQKGQYVLYKNNEQNIYTRITAVDLYDGQVFLGLESPISLANESKNASFSVVSNYVESNDFYFNTRTEPEVSITIKNLTSLDGNTVVLSSPILEATGLYTQQQSIPIESYVFNLYSSDGELVDTSGDIISSKITYTYKGLMTNRNYTLELAVTNEDDVVTKVEKEILCSYSDGDSDISTWAYFVTDKNNYTEIPA